VFERFTDPARGVVVAAEREARALGHDHLGTEHLLLGLLADPAAPGGRALTSLGVSYEEFRNRLTTIVPGDVIARSKPIAFTPSAKKVLELSVREAVQQDHVQIGTGDLALALLRVPGGTALRMLREAGVDGEVARARLLAAVAETIEPTSRPVPSVVPAPRLPADAQLLLRRALRVGSFHLARRYLPLRAQRTAGAAGRVVRAFGSQSRVQHRPALPGSTTPLVPAACLVCGRQPPECGTLYASAQGALICERCIT
jgi:Clp amino terminal domain, pathogenicity island component